MLLNGSQFPLGNVFPIISLTLLSFLLYQALTFVSCECKFENLFQFGQFHMTFGPLTCLPKMRWGKKYAGSALNAHYTGGTTTPPPTYIFPLFFSQPKPTFSWLCFIAFKLAHNSIKGKGSGEAGSWVVGGSVGGLMGVLGVFLWGGALYVDALQRAFHAPTLALSHFPPTHTHTLAKQLSHLI